MKLSILILSLFSVTSAFGLTNEEATEMVNAAFKNTVPGYEKKYCVNGVDETCRIMYGRKNKATGRTEFFYDLFYSKDRKVGSICYFVPSKSDPTQFHVVSDTNLNDYVRKINLIGPLMAKIIHSFDFNSVFFYNLKMPRLGTTKYILANMVQSEGLVYLEGKLKDENDSSFQERIRIDYKRVR